MDADFIDLYGADAAQGRQVHQRRFWSCFSGPVGTEADAHRERLLVAYRTIPLSLRRRFLSRLHAEDASVAIGAWAELEFVHLVAASGLALMWTDEKHNSTRGIRSIDLVIQAQDASLHAEVTHYREETPPPGATQLFSFFGKERVPGGSYALTVGRGQPPIARLRAALRRTLRTGTSNPIDVHVDDWSIRQLAWTPSAGSADASGEEHRPARYVALIDRVRRALKKKRRQARDAGLRDVLLAVVLLDRDGSAFLELAAERSEDLASLIYGSNSSSSDVAVHAVAIGAVPSDRFPPVPVWSLILPESDPIMSQISLNAPTIEVSRPNRVGNYRTPEEETVGEPGAERSVYYARVAVISASRPLEGAARVVEFE